MKSRDAHSKENENVIPVTRFLYKQLDKLVNKPAVMSLKRLYPENSWERMMATELLDDPNFNEVGLNHESISYVDPVKLITLMAHRIAAERAEIRDVSLHLEDSSEKVGGWTDFAPSTPFDGSDETVESGDPIFAAEQLTDPTEKVWAEYTEHFEDEVNQILRELIAAYGDDIFNPALVDPPK